MPASYIVAPGHEFNYPADQASLRLLSQLGGRSKVKPEQLAQLKFKTVTAGQDCSDMPIESLEVYVARGWVVEGTPEVKHE